MGNRVIERFSLAEALDLHGRAVREAYRRKLAARSALEAATDEHEAAQKAEASFKEFVRQHMPTPTHPQGGGDD